MCLAQRVNGIFRLPSGTCIAASLPVRTNSECFTLFRPTTRIEKTLKRHYQARYSKSCDQYSRIIVPRVTEKKNSKTCRYSLYTRVSKDFLAIKQSRRNICAFIKSQARTLNKSRSGCMKDVSSSVFNLFDAILYPRGQPNF